MSLEMPRVVGLCPTHGGEFYVPHGGVCPQSGCEEHLVSFVRSDAVGGGAQVIVERALLARVEQAEAQCAETSARWSNGVAELEEARERLRALERHYDVVRECIARMRPMLRTGRHDDLREAIDHVARLRPEDLGGR